jgi:hypothetical protein
MATPLDNSKNVIKITSSGDTLPREASMLPSHVNQGLAARIIGTSRQMVREMIRRKELHYIEFYGVKLIPLEEVELKKKPKKE